MAIGETTAGTDALLKKTGLDSWSKNDTGAKLLDFLKSCLNDRAKIKVFCACKTFTCGDRDMQQYPNPYPGKPDPLVPREPGSGSGAIFYSAAPSPLCETSSAYISTEPALIRSSWAGDSVIVPAVVASETPRSAEANELLDAARELRASTAEWNRALRTGGGTVEIRADDPTKPKSCKGFYGPATSAGDAYINGTFDFALEVTSIGKVTVYFHFDAAMSTTIEGVSIVQGKCSPPECMDEILSATVRVKYTGSVKIFASAELNLPIVGKIPLVTPAAGVAGGVSFGLGCVEFVPCKVECKPDFPV